MEKLLKLMVWCFEAGIDVELTNERYTHIDCGIDLPVLRFRRGNRQSILKFRSFVEMFERIEYEHKKIYMDLCIPELKL